MLPLCYIMICYCVIGITGCLDSFFFLVSSMVGFTCRAVRVAPCLEHVCAGGGG